MQYVSKCLRKNSSQLRSFAIFLQVNKHFFSNNTNTIKSYTYKNTSRKSFRKRTTAIPYPKYPASRGPSIFLTYLGRSKGLCSQGISKAEGHILCLQECLSSSHLFFKQRDLLKKVKNFTTCNLPGKLWQLFSKTTFSNKLSHFTVCYLQRQK